MQNLILEKLHMQIIIYPAAAAVAFVFSQTTNALGRKRIAHYQKNENVHKLKVR